MGSRCGANPDAKMGAGQKCANIRTQATICDCHRRSVLTEERAAPYRLHSDKLSGNNQPQTSAESTTLTDSSNDCGMSSPVTASPSVVAVLLQTGDHLPTPGPEHCPLDAENCTVHEAGPNFPTPDSTAIGLLAAGSRCDRWGRCCAAMTGAAISTRRSVCIARGLRQQRSAFTGDDEI